MPGAFFVPEPEKGAETRGKRVQSVCFRAGALSGQEIDDEASYWLLCNYSQLFLFHQLRPEP